MEAMNNTFTLSSSIHSLGWVGDHLTTTSLPITLLLLPTSLFVFAFFFSLHCLRPTEQKLVNLPPGPSPWPILGSLPEIILNKPAFRWILALMKEMDTDILCLRLANTHVIPVTCPEIAREFLKKNDAIFATRPVIMSAEYASRGYRTIITTPWGDQWKKMRRVVAHELLAPAKLRWLLNKRTEEADNLIHCIYNQCKREISGAVSGSATVDVREAVQHYSGNVIRKMMFNTRNFGAGRDDGGPGIEEVEHVDALFTVLSVLYVFTISDYIPKLRWLDLEGHEKIMKKAINAINKYHDPIIDGRIRKWKEEPHGEPKDMLDLMILAKDSDGKPALTPEDIKAQTSELMIATVDNPSNAVEWAMAEMINQPNLIKKAVEELDMVVGKERLVQESDIPQLNYVKACAREAFRLHPIVPFNIPHVSNEDATVAGYFIPKGSFVLLSRSGLGRNPKVWDDPLRFNPDRHHPTTTNVELIETDLRFISFSTGRRGCMGAPLGSAMTVILLARLLQGFTWSAPPGELKIELTESENDMFLAKALHARAEPRLPLHLYSPK